MIENQNTTKPVTPRSLAYLAFVRSCGCCVCGDQAEAHHAGRKYKGLKPSDYSAVPLCTTHHRELHDHGYQTFQRKHDVLFVEEMAKCMHRWISTKPLELPVSLR